jgi:hypothetical protein
VSRDAPAEHARSKDWPQAEATQAPGKQATVEAMKRPGFKKGEPVMPVDADAKAEIRRVIEPFDDAFRSINPAWPKDCCVATCAALAPFLNFEFLLDKPHTWRGEFVIVNGEFGSAHLTHTMVWHNWLLVPDRTIVDPTGGQFFGGPALHFVHEDDEAYGYYEAEEYRRAV